VVRRASGPVFKLCAPGLIFGGTEGVGYYFLVLRSRTRFCGTDGVRSRFHDLLSLTHFGRFRGCRVPFSYFARPNSFSIAPRASAAGYHFHVLRARNHFRRYLGRRVPFSCFALPDSFSALPRAPAPVFMFCAPGLAFGGFEGVVSRFHILCSRTRFGRYRGRRASFSCFALPDSFLAVPRASGPVFMFCAPALIIGETEGVGSHFHVLRYRTRFGRYCGRRVPFSCFALADSFSIVPRASGPVFTFCAPGLIFGGTEGVGSRFQVLRSLTHFRRY
jgi:hypothetical protein